MKKGNFQAVSTARALNIAPRSGVHDNNKTHPKGVDQLIQYVVAQGNVTMTSKSKATGCRQCGIDNVHKDRTAFKATEQGSVTE